MSTPSLSATQSVRLDTGWLFGGEISLPGPVDRLLSSVIDPFAALDFDDAEWESVTVPHTVVPLSWQHWDPSAWEKVWVYRRPIEVPGGNETNRVFVDFGAVMTTAVVYLNGTRLGEHRGGYLPFSFEITDLLAASGNNVLTVVVDSRFNINVPPNLTDPAKSSTIDYWQPGGIHRDVQLRFTPQSHIASVGTTHLDVLDDDRRHSIFSVELDSRTDGEEALVTVELVDASGAVVATGSATTRLAAGSTRIDVQVGGLQDVSLWDTGSPTLYTVVTTLGVDGTTVDRHELRTGYREARWEIDGFYLNGTRRYLLGVNRHGYYPFGGFSMPERAQRRDAWIIKNELNCVMVRCSHYPQDASFLDACDELGLLVWEESPGWQYVGDSSWQDAAVGDITAMIARDRHRPSIVVWGARLNETPDRPEFYAKTEALVKSLDPTRATSGTMHGEYARTATFQHDIFSYDDYESTIDRDGERRPNLLPPVEDRPYLLSEAISSRSSPSTMYRRIDVARVQQHQALDYAHAHNYAMGNPRFTGLLAWVGFDYQAKMGNEYHGVKTSGLGDVFRILKPGAAIYQAQVSPTERIVLEPAFTWDPPEFGQAGAYGGRRELKLWGPGEKAMICSNCDRIEVFLGAERVAVVHPDRERFANLPFAPSFVDLRLEDRDSADLRLEGYLGDERVITRSFAGDRAGDYLSLATDDSELVADGVDATRVTLRILDRHGSARGAARIRVDLTVEGPGVLLGDNPFDLEQTGAVAAVWIRSVAGVAEPITLRAFTPEFGTTAVTIGASLPGAASSERG